MGINNLQTPRCSRCNAESYGGEIKITATNQKDVSGSLCAYCLPIVYGKVVGHLEDQVDALVTNQ